MDRPSRMGRRRFLQDSTIGLGAGTLFAHSAQPPARHPAPNATPADTNSGARNGVAGGWPTAPQDEVRFYSAKPVWATGKEKEKNVSLGFWAVFRPPAGSKVTLRVAASTVYRFFLNGNFRGYGPARGPHGYFRVDEWDLSEGIRSGENLVALEVAGYNVNSYYLLDQPSFLQAESVSGETILAATGGSEIRFEAGILPERVQKVQRYSFQRPFSEVYRLQAGCGLWRKMVSENFRKTDQSIFPAVKLLPRRVAHPKFFLRQPVWRVSEGRMETGIKPKELWKDRSLTQIGPKLKGFKEEELEVIPSIELQMTKTVPTAEIHRPYTATEKVRLGRNSFSILDFGTNLTGFLGAKLTCHRGTRFFFTFDEILSEGDVDFKRLGCVNIVLYEMPEGTFGVETFEPYTLRFLKLIVLDGECEVENIYLREYASPDVEQAHFAANDERLNRLFAAGRETYRQNAVDVFTDCPSRERAGWLCDSLFTSRVGCALAGHPIVEKNFFENFCLPDRFAFLPEGMLPMCYPADHNDGVFVPNWALWFVVQLEEYLRRSGDRELVDSLRPKVLRLFDYFRPFRNEDGLLEKLPGWVFVEWSHANDFVQDVNYPTNMLYAAALAAAAMMYALPELREEAERIRTIIRRQSFDGEFFVDNAVRKDGKLTVTRNRSEVCQYMAFFLDVATPATYPALWSVLVKQFGPARKQTKGFPEVYEANAFIGNMLRLEILSRQGLSQQILEESIAYLLYMAERTGTLWENVGAYASCNHGFASHIVWTLYRDVLGLYEVDSVNRVVRLRFSDLRLDWCEGSVPVAEGVVSLSWRRTGEEILYRVDVPAGYTVKPENESEIWVRQP